MATGIHLFSQTASSNATADSSINWAEGQAPSSVNDSARALMARLADYYKDIGGLATGGSSTAYTVTTNRAFASAAVMAGSTITIIPHATNGAAATLAVDGLTARAINTTTGVAVPAGALLIGIPYQVLYVHGSTEFVLLAGVGATPSFRFPGEITAYGGATAPTGWLLCFGQSLHRTDQPAFFAAISTSYGAADGTHFSLPDLRGVVPAGRDNMGGSTRGLLTTAGSSLDGTNLGAAAGAQSITLDTTMIPSHTHAGTTGGQSVNHTHTYSGPVTSSATAAAGVATGVDQNISTQTTSGFSQDHTHAFTTNAAGGGAAHINIQPTIILNYIIKT